MEENRNNRILNQLLTAYNKGALGHAYLFCGQKGLGKRQLIKEFISNLFDLENFDGFNADVRWISCREESVEILIDQIEDAQSFLALSSFAGKLRIVVVDDADKMSDIASNRFLKTLEEPAKNTVIILIAEGIDSMLKTIISRCQKIDFYPFSEEEIRQELLKLDNKIDPKKIDLIINFSQGRIEFAKKLASDDAFYKKYFQELEGLVDFIDEDVGQRIARIDRLTYKQDFNSTKAILLEFISQLNLLLHYFLEIKTGDDSLLTSPKINSVALDYSEDKILKSFEELAIARDNFIEGASPKIIFKNLCLNI